MYPLDYVEYAMQALGDLPRTDTHRVARAWQALRRVMRAAKQLATDRRIPLWVRVLLVIGCVQIPVLPVDEIALALALGILFVWYREPLRDALRTARRTDGAS